MTTAETQTPVAAETPTNPETGRLCVQRFVSGHGRKYKTILLDPPWPIRWEATNVGTKGMQYQTMTISEIAALPLDTIADEHCLLLMWTTNEFLAEALGLVRLWKYRYDKLFVWCKNNGMGGTPRSATEYLVIASRGRPGKPETRGVEMLLNWAVLPRTNRHSQKPRELRHIIEKFSVEPKIELFARERFAGWDAWGNEVSCDVELVTANSKLTDRREENQ